MTYVYEVDLFDILPQLPGIIPLDVKRDFASDRDDDLFLCALGFEDRCTSIPGIIAEGNVYRCSDSIYFEYATNPEDNEINRAELINSLQRFSKLALPMECDTEDFASNFRQIILRLRQKSKSPSITFDISVCTSKLLLTVLKVLFEFDIKFRIVYSEARTYHPTKEEATKDKSDEEELKLTKGVDNVFPSREHPGFNIDGMPEAVIAYATFNPKRTNAVIAYVDENLLEKPVDRVNWVIGIPHLQEDEWRLDYMVNTNHIPNISQSFKVSTFDYKDSLKLLNKLYKQFSLKYHFNISPLGSKMQALGIALFHYMKPEITIMFAPPVKYNATIYSEGCKAMWILDFGELSKLRNLLDEVGTIRKRIA